MAHSLCDDKRRFIHEKNINNQIDLINRLIMKDFPRSDGKIKNEG